MTSIDTESGTGVCEACGPVNLGYRNYKGNRVVRCGIALEQQRHKVERRPGRHGLSTQEMRDFKAGKVCAICASAERLAVDHCHTSNRLRGVLCFNCNVGIGFLGDSAERLQAAAEYLRMHEA